MGLKNTDICVVKGLKKFKNFSAILYSNKGYFNNEKIRSEVLDVAVEMVDNNPDIGAILLECSDLPPYSCEIQKVTGLPVFDYITMINFLNNSVAQKPYYGFI